MQGWLVGLGLCVECGPVAAGDGRAWSHAGACWQGYLDPRHLRAQLFQPHDISLCVQVLATLPKLRSLDLSMLAWQRSVTEQTLFVGVPMFQQVGVQGQQQSGTAAAGVVVAQGPSCFSQEWGR